MTERRHTSPDGELTLIITPGDDGDAALGFEGFSWHVHGDSLAATSNLRASDALAEFADDILGNRRIIALSWRGGRLEDAWVSDDPLKDQRYAPPDEALTFRYWDGTPWLSSGST